MTLDVFTSTRSSYSGVSIVDDIDQFDWRHWWDLIVPPSPPRPPPASSLRAKLHSAASVDALVAAAEGTAVSQFEISRSSAARAVAGVEPRGTSVIGASVPAMMRAATAPHAPTQGQPRDRAS